MRIILGVSGGIAAYKSVLLLRLLREAGHSVRVIPTAAALRFVGAATWEALSGEPASADVFDDVPGVPHVALGQGADLVVVAPATADLLSRAASGRADDLLTATLLTARCPVALAPAMHTEMWEHPATRTNVALLRERGVHIIEPASGRLTGADSGSGRLPEPADIAREALALIPSSSCAKSQDLAGKSVVVSAGGTREPIDPVRWIGNRSSGKQGIALAKTARTRGAHVTLVAANIEDAEGAADVVIPVETCLELRQAVRDAGAAADVIVMAAAVADFRPAMPAAVKIKKAQGPASIDLVENPDILAELIREPLRAGQVVVGFAAETGDETSEVLEYGRAKARRKGADLLAVNVVGEGLGFGTATNEIWLLNAVGEQVAHAAGSKREVADAIWDAVIAL
ncbi:MAG: bifunctional phosphopantothenoylcysteine decarboxylase/phosphopantothenate--cysteine ligase CoaBC [Promicromonosporaceae bacterium]|nr:bifunctional phosphopantothenoylcysteine decarboxylase/phosphopantothenate--cysteine ligase CoaBC [Promicromonosporaceae bacterium]